MSTLLEFFLEFALNPATSSRTVVECAGERWTYNELHSITSNLAINLFKTYGARPIVAVISENHPYYLALLLAVWKLGGTVAPLDYHAPSHLMKAMLENISPTFVVVPQHDITNSKLVQDLSIPVNVLGNEESSISSLTTCLLTQNPDSLLPEHITSDILLGPSGPDSVAAYIHTSSATSTSNIKCVPIRHEMIITNGRCQLKWSERKLDLCPSDALRVLSWSSFSHAMSICLDIGTNVLLTGGCYIFAVPPSSYASQEGSPYDVPSIILEAILSHEPDVLTGVPWILDGIIKAFNAEKDGSRRSRMTAALKKFRYLISSGAATSKQSLSWSKEQGLQVIDAIGMTEVGGAIFHSLDEETSIDGWCIADSCIQDGVYTLVDDHGDISDKEGELCITSKYIAQGYLKHQNSAFTIDEHGVVTFRTGDIYCYGSSSDRIIWKGRRDDFIQLKSGESLDPRPLERAFNECSAVECSCVVGNKFSSESADFVCAILQPTNEALQDLHTAKLQISKVVATINIGLPPPLRISWARVLLLPAGQSIPYTKKGMLFRKKLQSMFGSQLANHLQGSAKRLQKTSAVEQSAHSRDFIAEVVIDAVSTTLDIELSDLRQNLKLSFAELGMDSAMAIMIVNKINAALSLTLSPNTCHVYLDVESLTQFLCNGRSELPHSNPRSSQPITPTSEPIVIVGQAVRLPGDINDSGSLWQALVDRRTDILTSTPSDRWDHESFLDNSPGQITFSKSGFIDIASFDNAFFGIPGSESLYISPTARLALEVSFEALENANIPVSVVKGTDMGVFIAAGLDTSYGELLFFDKGHEAHNRFYGTGLALSAACGRISYLLDIHGPSTVVETACSGGMVALDQAVRHLQSGRGESAIVTAVNTHTQPGMFGFLSAQKMTSTNSRSATFTNEADGYATSEGTVSLIVKTQSAAERDGDTILGVIKATDTRHNGRTQGLVAPSIAAQVALQRSVLRLASLEPRDIDFMETHGTGTSLGDLMEIEGINEVFKSSHTSLRPLVLGAAKTCVGHTETASGLVGVVKTLESFSRNAVPGLTHLNENNMNHGIDLDIVPLQIPYSTYSLKPHIDVPLRALVVAYGFAGTLSATVLEAPKSQMSKIGMRNSSEGTRPLLFVVSGKSKQALAVYIKKYVIFCRTAPESLFSSICYTSCIGREHYRHRFACVVSNLSELTRKLEERLWEQSEYVGISNPRLLFGFPGQGSHFDGMARDLAYAYSGFRTILTEYAHGASLTTNLPILPLLLGADEFQSVDEFKRGEATQICIYVFQCAITTWLKSLGVEPNAVIGHSLGEVSAAVCAGALQYEDGLQLIIVRARTLKAKPSGSGAMVAISAPEQVILGYIDSLQVKGRVSVAVFNAEESLVVSGSSDAVDLIYQTAKLDRRRCVKLKVDQGFHSSNIEPGLSALEEWLLDNKRCFGQLKIPFYSSVTTDKIPPGESLPPYYWIAHARNPVKFWQTMTKLDLDETTNIFLDIGPQPTLWTHIQDPRHNCKPAYATTTKQGSNQDSAFLQAVAKLFENNASIDLRKLYDERGCFTKTTIPTYPFQRQRHYPNFISSRNQRSELNFGPRIALLLTVDQPLLDLIYDHRIEGRQVLPGIAFADLVAMALADNDWRLGIIRFHQPLVLERKGSTIQAEVQRDGSFIITYGTEKTKICSGSLVYRKTAKLTKHIDKETLPQCVLNKEAIYASFEDGILFGPTFQNVAKVTVWPDRIEGLIRVPTSSTTNTPLNRIRKLDPCLHMFGAIARFVGVPELILKNGLFLPTSLHGFVLHSETIPSEFYCIYYLPMELGENYGTVAVGFKVFSLSGELLVSCEKYSVAWVPKGVAIQMPVIDTLSRRWTRNAWRQEDILQGLESPSSFARGETVVYFSDFINTSVLSPFVSVANEVIIADIGVSNGIRYTKTVPSAVKDISIIPVLPDVSLVDELSEKKIYIVLDLTRYHSPGTDMYTTLWKHALWIMKFAMSGKVDVRTFVVVSSMSLPTGRAYCLCQPPGIGAVVQGMLRVYRRESGLSPNVVWGIDLPDQLTEDAITSILSKEIRMHAGSSLNNSTVVAYRRTLGYREEEGGAIIRLVPVLLPRAEENNVSTNSMNGLAIIIGMGSIGQALAGYLVGSGCSTIVFMGRRGTDNAKVIAGLEKLRSSYPSVIMDYVQSDVTDVAGLRLVLNIIITRFGAVKHIIYTAGVISDATISTVLDRDFERVLSAKALGAWNVHVVSQELSWNLDTFSMLSSISVPIGNIGQVSYVAGNAFLDSLAAYRRSVGLPGVSLQLGPWESNIAEGIDLSQTDLQLISHAEGIPIIIQALSEDDPVQIIANWNVEKLAGNPEFSNDPMFREFRLTNRNKENVVQKPYSKEELAKIILGAVKSVLEINGNDQFDMEESLISCGMDSISFAQMRGNVLQRLGVDIPVRYLSETFSINKMISDVCNGHAS